MIMWLPWASFPMRGISLAVVQRDSLGGVTSLSQGKSSDLDKISWEDI